MLKIVESKIEIARAENRLKKSLDIYSNKEDIILLGGIGWHNRCKVDWSNELGIWWTNYELENRFENAFGVGEPKWDSGYGHSIDCVIDIPFEGINRRIGGAFAIDRGELFLLHRGRIGGGRKNIGPALFFHNYRGGKLVTVEDGELSSTMALVGAISSQRFPLQVADFVFEIQRIKKEGTTGAEQEGLPSPKHEFKEEFSGKKEYSIGDVIAECDHGLIVNSLAEILRSQGFKTANERPIDLYIVSPKGRILALFEVKTDSATTDCYTATGQLLFYSSGMREKPKLFAVFPESLDRELKNAFGKIGIQVIDYEWEGNKLKFTGVDSFKKK